MQPVHIKNIILESETMRYCEIYKITNTINQKKYIGQAVSHILNHKKYRPYGMEGRFRCHISEAFSSKKNQCHYLNNAIRKYGIESFTVELITTCNVDESDSTEKQYISKYDSLYPNGYNLNTGGGMFNHTEESRKRVSIGVMNHFKDKKFQRFMCVTIDKNDADIEKWIRPLKRNNAQYGWYVYIQRKKADFGGSHISLDESKKMARDFIFDLKKLLAKHLDAGNPLEPLLPLSLGNLGEELG